MKKDTEKKLPEWFPGIDPDSLEGQILKHAKITPEKVINELRRKTLHWRNYNCYYHSYDGGTETFVFLNDCFEVKNVKIGKGINSTIDYKWLYTESLKPYVNTQAIVHFYRLVDQIRGALAGLSFRDCKYGDYIEDFLFLHYEDMKRAHINGIKIIAAAKEYLSRKKDKSMLKDYARYLGENQGKGKLSEQEERFLRWAFRDWILSSDEFKTLLDNCLYIGRL